MITSERSQSGNDCTNVRFASLTQLACGLDAGLRWHDAITDARQRLDIPLQDRFGPHGIVRGGNQENWRGRSG